jgi:hypothetical protein
MDLGNLQDIYHMSKICDVHGAVSIHMDMSMDTDRDTYKDRDKDILTDMEWANFF